VKIFASTFQRHTDMKDWLAVLLACGLLLAMVVLGQMLPDRSGAAMEPPGPQSDWLDERLPREIGGWTGEPLRMDQDVLGTAGAAHGLTRRYTNRTTGDPFQIHDQAPEMCYSASSFQRAGVVQTGWIENGPAPSAFAVVDFLCRDSAPPDGVTVWYAWRGQIGPWRPHVKRTQLAQMRSVWRLTVTCHSQATGPSEASPCKHFLQAALPELENVVAERPPHENEASECQPHRHR
jgi:hypothetical protein